jgi:LEA14-like dessication related protein
MPNNTPIRIQNISIKLQMDRRLEIAPGTCMALQNACHERKAMCV